MTIFVILLYRRVMENIKDGLEEGCLEAGSTSEDHDTHSLKSGSSDDEFLRSNISIRQHLLRYLQSTLCQVRCKLVPLPYVMKQIYLEEICY